MQTSSGVTTSACEKYTCDQEGTRYSFILREDLAFADGKPITGQNFLDRFLQVGQLQSSVGIRLNSIIGFEQLLRSGKAPSDFGVTAKGLTLQIYLSQPDYNLPCKLAHPSLSPLRLGNYVQRASGVYYTSFESELFVDMAPNPFHRHYSSKLKKLTFQVCKEPTQAIHLFEEGLAQATPACLFPYADKASLSQKEGYIEDSPLFYLALLPLKEDSRKLLLRHSLNNQIDRDDLAEAFHGGVIPVWNFHSDQVGPKEPLLPSEKEDLKISICYDDYYPNREILEKLGRQLKALGISLTLLKDDFENPGQVSGDFRLIIFSNYSGWPAQAYRQLCYSTLIINDDQALAQYQQLLKEYDMTQEGQASILDSLSSILREKAFVMPLVAMRSLYFVTPSLQNFRWSLPEWGKLFSASGADE